MSGQVSRGSPIDYQANELAGVAWLNGEYQAVRPHQTFLNLCQVQPLEFECHNSVNYSVIKCYKNIVRQKLEW